MDSSMCSSAPDPEMRIDGAIRLRSNVDPTFDSLVGFRWSGGATMAPLFSRIHTSFISVWTAISRAQGSYHSSCFFLDSKSKWDQSYLTKTCQGKEEGGNKHTWRAQYNGELYAAFGKDESLPKRNLLILSQLDGPAAPGKRIEEASDYFMHAPLGSGGNSSVGKASLLQLGRCDYWLDV
ncbi:hypothetical protein HAX54_038737 [Datura stramonium]|uniref:Uncharacterized protein ycf68 n=1 Tax=Datura stramonium TaxID=4076 RepID=A0ABS8W0X0_DATST|nr:hypothetical protein [Datura stramonium]